VTRLLHRAAAALCSVLICTFISSCGEGETGQITSGGNELGPETTQEVDDRAVEIPAVRNVLEPTSDNLPTPHGKESEQARIK
jgi:hypothetical protein